MGLSGYIVSRHLTLCDTAELFAKAVVSFYIHSNIYENSGCSTLLPAFGTVGFEGCFFVLDIVPGM